MDGPVTPDGCHEFMAVAEIARDLTCLCRLRCADEFVRLVNRFERTPNIRLPMLDFSSACDRIQNEPDALGSKHRSTP
jgi:hypothetical protein